MKLVFVALAIFAVSLGSALPSYRQSYNLQDDLNDFIALLPTDQLIAIVVDYLANDEEVQEIVENFQGDEFKALVQQVDSVPEYIEFLNIIQKNGLDIYYYVNILHEFLGLPTLPVPSSSFAVVRGGKGIRGLLDDIEAVLPVEKIRALFNEKMQSSPQFANLVNVMRGEEFKGIINRLRANPTFRDIVERAKAKGVDLARIVEILNKIFGWGIETRQISTFNLQDDLNDFIALIPTNQIIEIAVDYLANDEEVQEIVENLQADEFKDLVQQVDSVPEYIEFLNIIQKNGLDIYYYVNILHDFLELPRLPVPSAYVSVVRKGKGIRGLLDDIEAVLPVEKIKALFDEKLQSSPEFANLVNVMRGEEFKGIINRLRANPTFRAIVERAKAKGVDLARIIEILNKIFGWGIEGSY